MTLVGILAWRGWPAVSLLLVIILLGGLFV